VITRITTQDASNTSAAASVSATYAATPTKGRLLVAAVWSNKPTGSNLITNWTVVQDRPLVASGNSVTVLAKIATGSESTTVTATSSTATNMRLFITEYDGVNSATVTDAVHASGGQSNGAAATAVTNDAIASFTALGGGGAGNILVFEAIAWGAATSSPAFGVGSLLYNNTRMCVGEDLDATHSGHLLSTSHFSTWSWTTSTTYGVASVAFRGRDNTIPMTGVGQ